LVPSLEEIVLYNQAQAWQLSFSLSDELLENTHGVAIVRLAFDNGMILKGCFAA
jgi:hypothetical protein